MRTAADFEREWMRGMRPDAVRYFGPGYGQFMPPKTEQKYSPDQPRVPAGNPDGGQWTEGSNGESVATVELSASSKIPRLPLQKLPPSPSNLPEPPEERPPQSRDRTAVMVELGLSAIAGHAAEVADVIGRTSWLYHAAPYVWAYTDRPRTLQELQEAASDPRTGYDIHHIVEQTSARQDGYPNSKISASDNLVRIPTLRHWLINGWYQRKNEDHGGMSPRDYLRGKDWDERQRVGLEALRIHGVLRP